MAAVDLEDLVPSVKAAVNEPGAETFPDATTPQWVAKLSNAFWEGKLNGFTGFADYTEADGIVSPITGDTTMSRELQQIIVFFAAEEAIRNKLLNLNTSFRAKAGPVEYETQQSAQTLKAILDSLVERRNLWLNRLSDVGYGSTYYFDSYLARQDSLISGEGVWVG